MLRRVACVSVLLLVAVVSALAVLPARWLLRALPVDAPIALVDASGSVWSGSAIMAIGQGALRRTLAEPVHWGWRWSNGALRVAVHHAALGGELLLTPGWRGWHISAQSVQLPALVLASLDARLNAVRPEGVLVLRWTEQSLDDGVWVDVDTASTLPTVFNEWLATLESSQENRYLLRLRP